MSTIYETVGAYARLGLAWLGYVGRTAPRAVLRRARHPATFGIAYAAIGLLTFGHVAAASTSASTALKMKQLEFCNTPDQKLANDFCFQRFDNDFPPPAMRGVAAGAFWPLYLSWELQQ